MEDPIEELRKQFLKSLSTRKTDWKEKVYDSQQYQQELKYLQDITKDFIDSIRLVAIYSTRASNVYENFLTINAIDDLLQSAIFIKVSQIKILAFLKGSLIY